MTPAPLVSILMPAYNHAAYVDGAVQSALDQTVRDFELIAFDDGSSDDTLNRLSRWQEADPRVKVFQHPGGANLGLTATLRAAQNRASGSFIGLLASDDLWTAQKLGVQLAAMADGAGWCYGRAAYIDAAGDPVMLGKGYSLEGHALPPLEVELWDNQIVALTVLVRRELFERVGGFKPGVILDDLDLWLRLLCFERPRYVDAVVGCYRFSAESLNSRMLRDRADLAGVTSAVRSLAEWNDLPPEHAPTVLSWLRCHTALATLSDGDWGKAAGALQPGDARRFRWLLEDKFGRVRSSVGVGPIRMFLERLIREDMAFNREFTPLLSRVRPRSHVRDLFRFVGDRRPVQAGAQARSLIGLAFRTVLVSRRLGATSALNTAQTGP